MRATESCGLMPPTSRPGRKSRLRSTRSRARSQRCSMSNSPDAATKMLTTGTHVTSETGHDPCNLTIVGPAATIFVPCKEAVSRSKFACAG
jgi:hypothetical protein